MSDGKLNYERRRARAEIREEMRQEYGHPHDVQTAREIRSLAIFAGAVMLRSFGDMGATEATSTAELLMRQSSDAAKRQIPGPDTEAQTNA